MDTEKFIHECARRGISKAETARTLGWTQYKMEKIVSVMGTIDWPARGESERGSAPERAAHCIRRDRQHARAGTPVRGGQLRLHAGPNDR